MGVTYRVLPRKDSLTCDVHATEDGRTRVVNTFNSEADAWEWVTEQEQAREICERLAKGHHNGRRASMPGSKMPQKSGR
jgi:hypothetical protein